MPDKTDSNPSPLPSASESQSRPQASETAMARLLGLSEGDIAPGALSPDNWGEGKRRREREEEPSYYDISMLKAPLWKWEIAIYFFLGGLSSGAFVLARLGEILGRKQYRDLTRAGTYISAAALLPCPALLIHDLGDPKRFHHMLRVFKPSSPMNLGSWTLTGFGAMATLAALREYVRDREDIGGRGEVAESPSGKLLDRSVMMATDAAGIPLGLLLAGYTGVLLSTSANPLWGRNPWLGALFSASAMHTASSSIRLALESSSSKETPAVKALAKIDTVGTVVEAASMAAYLGAAGELAEPLTKGRYKTMFTGGVIGLGLLAPAILDHLPLPKKAKRWTSLLACLLSLFGGFALRWAMVHAGKDSADDPEQARKASSSYPSSASPSPPSLAGRNSA